MLEILLFFRLFVFSNTRFIVFIFKQQTNHLILLKNDGYIRLLFKLDERAITIILQINKGEIAGVTSYLACFITFLSPISQYSTSLPGWTLSLRSAGISQSNIE